MNKHYEIIKTFDTLEQFLDYANEQIVNENFDIHIAMGIFIKHLESKINYYRSVIENMGNKKDIDW